MVEEGRSTNNQSEDARSHAERRGAICPLLFPRQVVQTYLFSLLGLYSCFVSIPNEPLAAVSRADMEDDRLDWRVFLSCEERRIRLRAGV